MCTHPPSWHQRGGRLCRRHAAESDASLSPWTSTVRASAVTTAALDSQTQKSQHEEWLKVSTPLLVPGAIWKVEFRGWKTTVSGPSWWSCPGIGWKTSSLSTFQNDYFKAPFFMEEQPRKDQYCPCLWHFTAYFGCVISFEGHSQPVTCAEEVRYCLRVPEEGTASESEVQCLVQDHTPCKWQSWDLNSAFLNLSSSTTPVSTCQRTAQKRAFSMFGDSGEVPWIRKDLNWDDRNGSFFAWQIQRSKRMLRIEWCGQREVAKNDGRWQESWKQWLGLQESRPMRREAGIKGKSKVMKDFLTLGQ